MLQAHVHHKAVAAEPGAVQVLPGAVQAAAKADVNATADTRIHFGGLVVAFVAAMPYVAQIMSSNHGSLSVGVCIVMILVAARVANIAPDGSMCGSMKIKSSGPGVEDGEYAKLATPHTVLNASLAIRDMHWCKVRIVDAETGHTLALERAEDKKHGRPKFEHVSDPEDARSHWLVVPMTGSRIRKNGAGAVLLTQEGGRNCIDHWGKDEEIQMCGVEGSENQGWRIEHRDGMVAFRKANVPEGCRPYLGHLGTACDGTSTVSVKVVSLKDPKWFNVHDVA